MKKVHYKYSSIFAPEIISYLKLRETTGKYIAKTESVLKDFDCFLHNRKHQTKALSEDVFISWQKTRQVSSATKCQDCSHMKMFCSYSPPQARLRRQQIYRAHRFLILAIRLFHSVPKCLPVMLVSEIHIFLTSEFLHKKKACSFLRYTPKFYVI